MSKPTNSPEDQAVVNESELSELDLLKLRADRLGIQYHHKIGAVKLSKLIDERLAMTAPKEPEAPASNVPITRSESEGQRRVRLSREANKLVRIRVTNMNPAKREWEGEIYTVSNSVVGTLKKYVPFNNEEGWHVPQMMLNMMQEKKCQIFVTEKTRFGEKRVGKLIKELNIEILPPLTYKELTKLANDQARRHAID
jgi:hypothetical protein